MIDVSAFLESLGSRPVAVFGLGLSGLSAIRALKAAGAEVIAWDDDPGKHKSAQEAGAEIKELIPSNLALCGTLILSPGIPYKYKPHPIVQAAEEAGLEIICDIEVLYRCGHGCKTVGVTGTNGKSTTTALIAHILNEADIESVAIGNIGLPVLDMDLPGEDGVLVIEISSYQMDLCPTFRPDIGVLLSITPDHIDRHGSFEAYKAAKMRMLDGAGMAIREEDTHEAAAKVAQEFGVSEEQIEAAIKTFVGLPHRQKFVRRIDTVDYINDSKATNAESCIYALEKFDDIYLIVGGLAKEGGLSGIEQYKDKIRHIFLIGDAMDDFASWCGTIGLDCTKSVTLEKAVQDAHKMAQENSSGVVLLAPACASFDQYPSFEARGDHFEKLVMALSEGLAA